MRLGKALRDPWVWGQAVLILMVGALPLIARGVPPDSYVARLLGPAEFIWRIGAVVPLLPGVLMLVWGALSLGPNLTPATEPRAKGVLVERGAYSVVRHPIYLGLSLCLWAVGWWLTSPRVGLVVAIASFLYFDRKAAVEERWMVSRFPGYEPYRKRVAKLIPGIR